MREETDIVLCHNDFQENNILLSYESDGSYKLTLIDFEYAILNFRGYDIATLINEGILDYSYKGLPKFKVHRKHLPSFEENGEVDNMCRMYLERHYNQGAEGMQGKEL